MSKAAGNLHVTNKPDQIEQFRPYLTCPAPEFDSFENEVVHLVTGRKYAIVHQYDRVPEWKAKILKKFNVEDEADFFTYKV